MSILSHAPMINHHGSGIFSQLGETLQVWRRRRYERYQLAEMTERELQDAGVTWSDVALEAEKPFWRS